MSNSRNSYLLKNTAIFTIGNLATKFISFFLVPLYTNVLSTSDYGTVDLVATICTIAVPILTLNIMEAVMRFNLDKGADRNKITKIGIVVLIGGFIVGLIVIPLCSLWDKVNNYGILIYLYMIFSASSQVFLCDLRGKELLVLFSVGNILNTLLIAVFNILFLLVFKWGITGYLLAYTLASAVVAIYALIAGKGYKAIGAAVDYQKMREMVKYSIVLIPNSFMWWIMNSSDHIMVTSMIGIAANGIYAISYKFPTLITTVTGIFNQAWSYSAIREEEAEDSEKYTNKIFFSLRGVLFIVGICMLAVMKPFLKLYVAAEYFEAWKYTPFLIVGCVFLTMATFMSTSYTVHKDSKGFLISGTFGAVLNVVLNFALIPMIGVYGAALATCFSYVAVFVFRAFHTKKYMSYKVIDKEFVVGTIGLLINSVLMFFEGSLYQIGQIIVAIGALFLLKNTWEPFFKMAEKRLRKSK